MARETPAKLTPAQRAETSTQQANLPIRIAKESIKSGINLLALMLK
jgi:hypothetical protein